MKVNMQKHKIEKAIKELKMSTNHFIEYKGIIMSPNDWSSLFEVDRESFLSSLLKHGYDLEKTILGYGADYLERLRNL